MNKISVDAINIGDPDYNDFTFHLTIGEKKINMVLEFEDIMTLGTAIKKLKSNLKFERWKLQQEKKNVS